MGLLGSIVRQNADKLIGLKAVKGGRSSMTYYGDINHVPASTTGNKSLNKVPETFTGYEHEGVIFLT